MLKHIKTEVKEGILCMIMRKHNYKVVASVQDEKDTFLTWEDAEKWVDKRLEARTPHAIK